MTLSGLEYGFFITKEHNIGTVTGTFVNPNNLAGYLGMCLGLGVGLMLPRMSTTPAASWRESGRRLLNTILGQSPPDSDLGNGTKHFGFHSCNIKLASQAAFGGLYEVPGTWSESR